MIRLLWKQLVLPGEAYHIARCDMCGPCPFKLHTHDFAEVFWVERGKGVHDINCRRLPLERGTLVAMRPRDRHAFRCETEDGYTIVNVAFTKDTLRLLRSRYFRTEDRFFWANGPLPFQVTLEASRMRWLQNWTEHLSRAPRTRLEGERFLIELLRELSARTAVDPENSLPDWLRNALEGIRDPRHFMLGTPQLAKLAARTPQHVNVVLKTRLGLTATEVVNRARLDYAAIQLRMSTRKILEICLDCGFQNLGHFYTLFRRQFGMTPHDHRQRARTVLGFEEPVSRSMQRS
ncbi:MAG: helix-turn-helix domain-containing protein [Limisphaerales bacterium]